MAVETQLYDVLTILTNASTEEISKAYKKLALKFHPDKTNHDETLTERFKEITRAYEILKDSRTRKVYDRYGEAGLNGNVPEEETVLRSRGRPNGPMGGFPFGGSSSVFSQMFSDMNSMFGNDNVFESFNLFPFDMHSNMSTGGGNMRRQVRPADSSGRKTVRGRDIHHSCKVTLSDMYYGKKVVFQLPKNSMCRLCSGTGGSNAKLCSTCKGRGRVIVTMFNNMSRFQELTSCDDCGGTGIYIFPRDVCMNCNRMGYVKENKIIKTFIYPGSKDGDKIILKKQADEGRDVIPGDVVIHLQEIQHPFLTRKYNDLYMEHEVELKIALLGGKIVLKDFLKEGQDLEIFVNVHGNKQLNESIDNSIQQGEVVGTISSGEPKIVKNLGMPINYSDGVFYENLDEISNMDHRTFDLSNYKKGNLFIKFNVRLPKISDFSHGVTDLLALQSILPSSKAPSPSKNCIKGHLSNISGMGGGSDSITSTSPSSSSSRYYPEEGSVSGNEYGSDYEMVPDHDPDVNDSDDSIQEVSPDDVAWKNRNTSKRKKRRRGVDDMKFHQSGIEC
ncbi:uncharacterized protein PRCAT00005151001 [Priceomyces carsonii]|uniref:uncharacterized protein n=1 Tax=Priceomyces carsonii TaxID=28549 RepID=UPI002ED98375|nr:unnamed protein product [Priceomyces carsonii]